MDTRAVDLRYQNADVAEGYDRARFHGLRGRYNNWRLRSLVKMIMRTLGPAGLVVDLPCGTGRVVDCLAPWSRRVIAADISSEMLAVARRRTRGVSPSPRLLEADARQLPFPPESLDVVFCIRFLHLLDRESRIVVLNELARVTRRWVVVEYRSVTKPLRTAKRVIQRWARRSVGRTITVSEVVEELRASGLIAERCYSTSRWFSGSVLIVARASGRYVRVSSLVPARSPTNRSRT